MPITITPDAAAQAAALGVVIDLVDVAERVAAIDPPHGGRCHVRLGRPSRARLDVRDGVIVAVQPSSPRARPGEPDVRGGDPDRKAARDQERWERKRGGRTHGLSPEGETPPTQMRLGADVLAALDDLVAAATARGERATRSSVVRELVLRARA